jgi:ribosomal protein S27E
VRGGRLTRKLEDGCPKCGMGWNIYQESASRLYCAGCAREPEGGEHIHRQCQYCQYVWTEPVIGKQQVEAAPQLPEPKSRSLLYGMLWGMVPGGMALAFIVFLIVRG